MGVLPRGAQILEGSVQAPSSLVNLFEITNRDELTTAYRLVAVRQLPPGEAYDKNFNRLLKQVAYEIKQPAAAVRRGDDHYLAIPAGAPLPKREQRLMPYVAILDAEPEIHQLALAALDPSTVPIAEAFLQFAFRTPLWHDHNLWEAGRSYFRKHPMNEHHRGDKVDIYPGFSWNVIAQEDGRLFLAIDVRFRYVDRLWLPQRLGSTDDGGRKYLMRHCLYHFGHQWYIVQLMSITGPSVAVQLFLPDGTDTVVSVLDYTRHRWEQNCPAWVRKLDPDSPAIIYRYPGNEQERHGALALCKLTISTADAEAAGLHRRSILEPAKRFERITQIVERHFQRARFGGRPIRVTTEPLAIEGRSFPVPAQRFGQDRVLAVRDETSQRVESTVPATDIVRLDQLGRARLGLLLDPEAGPLDKSPFDAQYLLMPRSLPRFINEDFERRFVTTMREISGQQEYAVRRVLYDDRGATSLHKQVQSIRQAIDQSGITRGYVLLVLPPEAKADLHNYIKAELWPDLQLQCAMARKIASHYEQQQDGYGVVPREAGKVASYVRNCALGMMAVNRKWAWSLAEPLHYDVYIGIDVLNRMAGFTFVYGNGQHIFFRNYKSKQAERLTTPQLRSILAKHLREDLENLGLRPRSLIIHRDGRTFASERAGLRAAVQDLQRDGVLPLDTVVGIVDIRKSTANRLRIIDRDEDGRATNPAIGRYYYAPGSREGIVCTTGWPFRLPGTAKPLAAAIVEGPLNIQWVLEDIFALSQLIFTAPDLCARLPVTNKLADDLLEPIASASDEEAAEYDDEETADAGDFDLSYG